MFPGFLRTRSGYVSVLAIALIEEADSKGFHRIHYDLGAGVRETLAAESAVNALLDRCEHDAG